MTHRLFSSSQRYLESTQIHSAPSTLKIMRRLFGLTLSALMMPSVLGFSLPALASDEASHRVGTPHNDSVLSSTIHNEPDFSGTGRPPERGAGHSRGDDVCPNPDQTMVPLVPQGEGGGWTTTATPTVWVYVPFALSDTYRAKLVVKSFRFNEKGEVEDTTVARERFTLPTTHEPGIYQFALPLADDPFSAIPTNSINSEEPLPGYRWTLEIFCNPDGGRPILAEGIIRRVDMAPSVEPSEDPAWQLNDPEQISAVYAQNRIWYDALTVLGEALHRESDNEQYKAAWQRLLSYSTVGLEAIAHQPLGNCCTLLNDQ